MSFKNDIPPAKFDTTVTEMTEQETITEDEAALYDRQIRLWGLDAQRRLRNSRVLLIGLRGLGAEIAKNIVLAGIKSLTLLDHTEVTEEDTCSQFLIPQSELGKNRAKSSLERTQQLNPMVDVTADDTRPEDKTDDYFTKFDVICATCSSSSLLTKIDQICADNNVKFFAGDVFGYYGYMFSDLGEHEYAEEVPKPKEKKSDPDSEEPSPKKSKVEGHETVTVKKCANFSRLQKALDVDWGTPENAKKIRRTPSTYFIMQILLKFMEQNGRRMLVKSRDEDITLLDNLRNSMLEQMKVNDSVVSKEFSSYCFAELSPVCAIVGGVIGQEIIKAVSQKDTPHNNFFFYNGVNGEGLVDKIGS